jgi:hypothetical protein
MGLTLGQVKSMFDEVGIKYEEKGELLSTAWTTDTYLDPDTNKHTAFIGIQLGEDGEFLYVVAPQIFKATGRHVDDFLRACMMIQWETKLMRFEYDASDGEVRATVQIPIEDGTLTPRQLKRCFTNIVDLLDKFYPALSRALSKGKVDLS